MATKIPTENSDRWAYDISQNPISKGEIYDTDVINQSIENILMTTVGERIFNINYGSNLMYRVFEIASEKTGEKILDSLQYSIHSARKIGCYIHH